MGKIRTRRRDLLLGSLFASFASAKSYAARMTGDKAAPEDRAEFFRRMFVPKTRLPGERGASYSKDSDDAGVRAWEGVHEGKGTIGVKSYRFAGATIPASFVTYDIPPHASEGVHTHLLDDPVEGSFDEFYYIVSGEGRMQVGEEIVPVRAGDHVFTPIGVPHGVENTSDEHHLKVFLTFIYR